MPSSYKQNVTRRKLNTLDEGKMQCLYTVSIHTPSSSLQTHPFQAFPNLVLFIMSLQQMDFIEAPGYGPTQNTTTNNNDFEVGGGGIT